jgi:pimeloyl-ACP methyl ester carboxylesterase
LHDLLAGAGTEGPYVLVGHSFGGYSARLFAASYASDVAGVVLIDAAHEDEVARMPPELQRLDAAQRQVYAFCRLGPA